MRYRHFQRNRAALPPHGEGSKGANYKINLVTRITQAEERDGGAGPGWCCLLATIALLCICLGLAATSLWLSLQHGERLDREQRARAASLANQAEMSEQLKRIDFDHTVSRTEISNLKMRFRNEADTMWTNEDNFKRLEEV